MSRLTRDSRSAEQRIRAALSKLPRQANALITGGGGTGGGGGGPVSAGSGITVVGSTVSLEDLASNPEGAYTNASITVDIHGRVIAAASGGGAVTGIGTTNFLPLFTDGPAGVIGDSLLESLGPGTGTQTLERFYTRDQLHGLSIRCSYDPFNVLATQGRWDISGITGVNTFFAVNGDNPSWVFQNKFTITNDAATQFEVRRTTGGSGLRGIGVVISSAGDVSINTTTPFLASSRGFTIRPTSNVTVGYMGFEVVNANDDKKLWVVRISGASGSNENYATRIGSTSSNYLEIRQTAGGAPTFDTVGSSSITIIPNVNITGTVSAANLIGAGAGPGTLVNADMVDGQHAAGFALSGDIKPTAAPTSKVGTVAVVGSLDTLMASDSAPPIDLDLIPTWGGLHTFNGGIVNRMATSNQFITGYDANNGVTWSTNSTGDNLLTVLMTPAAARTGITIQPAVNSGTVMTNGSMTFRILDLAGQQRFAILRTGPAAGSTGVRIGFDATNYMQMQATAAAGAMFVTLTGLTSLALPTTTSGDFSASTIRALLIRSLEATGTTAAFTFDTTVARTSGKVMSVTDPTLGEVFQIDQNGNFRIDTNFKIGTGGGGFYIKEGTNATMGVATLVAGTVVVSTTKVTANSRIQLSVQALGTVTAPKAIAVTARTAGTSFTITSADATDTSSVAWVIVEPA